MVWCNVASCVKELLERMNSNTSSLSSHRESLTLLPPPPIPQRETRPRSAGYTVTANCDTLARTPTRGGNDYSSLPVMHLSRQVDILYFVQWSFVTSIFSLCCTCVCTLVCVYVLSYCCTHPNSFFMSCLKQIHSEGCKHIIQFWSVYIAFMRITDNYHHQAQSFFRN